MAGAGVATGSRRPGRRRTSGRRGRSAAPAAQTAKSSTVHSYLVRAISATRPPGSTPGAISPLATASTSPANSAAVTGSPAPVLLAAHDDRVRGSAAAWPKGMSAGVPEGAGPDGRGRVRLPDRRRPPARARRERGRQIRALPGLLQVLAYAHGGGSCSRQRTGNERDLRLTYRQVNLLARNQISTVRTRSAHTRMHTERATPPGVRCFTLTRGAPSPRSANDRAIREPSSQRKIGPRGAHLREHRETWCGGDRGRPRTVRTPRRKEGVPLPRGDIPVDEPGSPSCTYGEGDPEPVPIPVPTRTGP